MIPAALASARDRMIGVHGARLVVAYGSFASGSADAASDLDLVAFAPVAAPFHDTGLLDGRELDAWVYPWDHPFTDPELVRVSPTLCLHDAENRFAGFEKAVTQTRADAHKPLDAAALADLAAWVRKMLVRSRTTAPEGLHRYHWLLSDGPELWCRFRGVPWEGPKKALAQMRTQTPEAAAAYAALLARAPDPDALEAWYAPLTGGRNWSPT